MCRATSTRTWLTIVVMAASIRGARAQELEPRAYAASPVGATFIGVTVSRSSGNVFTDPSLPVQDVTARLGVASAAVGHTFDLFTRTALVIVSVPFARG